MKIFKNLKLYQLGWIFSFIAIVMSAALFASSFNSELLNSWTPFSNSFHSNADMITIRCQNEFNWRDCYSEQLVRLSGRVGLENVLRVLDEIMVIDARANDCHLIAHEIAAAEVKRDPSNWLEIFKYVDQDMCMGGYIHGAIEGKKLFESSMKIDETTIPQICSSIQGATGNKNIDPCAHVMGHILLVENGADMKKASEVCNKLPGGAMQSYCNNGVFMENITRTNLATHGFDGTFYVSEAMAQSLQSKCDEFKGIAETSCWREIAHLYVDLANNNLEGVWGLCSRASTNNNRNECYMHSFNSILPLADFDLKQFSGICSRFGGDINVTNRCYAWAVNTLILSSKNLTGRAIKLCESSGDYKEYCYKVLGEKLSKVTEDRERKELCSEVEERYKNFCEANKIDD